MLKKMNKIAVTTILLSAMGTSTAFAAETTTTVTGKDNAEITGFVPNGFSSVVLDGTPKKTTSSIENITLTDARGTGAGWSVNLMASQFTNAGATNEPSTLPNNSLNLGKVSIVAGEGSSAEGDITKANGTIDNLSGVTILNAGINKGMGTYTISIADMELTLLPKDAKAGTYTSNITMTLSQGPTQEQP